MPVGPRIVSIVAAVAAAIALPACARPHAKAPSDAPPLSVPAAPPHEVEPIDQAAPPDIPLPNPPHRTPPRPTAQPPARPESRPEAPHVEAPKSETEPARPPDESPKPPATPTGTLQTTPAGAEGEMERGIRALLRRAGDDLNHIDYRNLNADARTQYDTAKRFIRQAEDAIQAKNLVFAKNLADKAAGLAAQLAGR